MSAWLSQTASQTPDENHARFKLAGHELVADLSGALYWPALDMLVVADLHFEKGSSFARSRQHLPPYDTKATLKQLAKIIAIYQPRNVIALGDSVHDRNAWDRLSDADRYMLAGLCQSVDDWVWIAGNHDPEPPQGVPGRSAMEIIIDGLVFRHEPGGPIHGEQVEVAGHLHPAARVIGKGGSARRPAFAHDGRRLILPAFGAYAGGLCLSSKAFRPMFDAKRFQALVCGRTRVFTVPGNKVLGWR